MCIRDSLNGWQQEGIENKKNKNKDKKMSHFVYSFSWSTASVLVGFWQSWLFQAAWYNGKEDGKTVIQKDTEPNAYHFIEAVLYKGTGLLFDSGSD